jgi:DNA-binding response OmpR family regulator
MEYERPPSAPLILVVDDDDAIRDMVGMLLEREGHRVLLVRDGVEALGAALARRIDLILLDLAMPRLTGEAFCRTYRERGGTAAVIFMTAADAGRVALARDACGDAGYLAKPFAVDDLLATVADRLSRPPVRR